MENKETVITKLLDSPIYHSYLGPLTAILLGMKLGLGGENKIMNQSWFIVFLPMIIHLVTLIILEVMNYFLKRK